MRSNNIQFTISLSIGFLMLFTVKVVEAEVLTCELKTVTIENGKPVKIRHEDGTVHSGVSVSGNWKYDGTALQHKSVDSMRYTCGSKPKSRDEVITKLSQRFVENPKIHGMDAEEAKWMTSYTADLMRKDPNCHLLVDASKSTQRKNMFFIDCNDKASKSHRYWVSRNDLSKGNTKRAAAPISKSKALEICNNELRARTSNPSTYDPALALGSVSRVVESVGRNVVEIDFAAKNSFGLEEKYRGSCVFESGELLEVDVTGR